MGGGDKIAFGGGYKTCACNVKELFFVNFNVNLCV